MNDRERDADFTGEAPEVFDFLEEVTQDLEEGALHPLRHYLARFAGHEEAISREYLALVEPASEASAPPAQRAQTSAAADCRVGPYTLLSEIGRGGQGVVYLAEDSRIDRRVALKVLPPAALFLSEDRRQRLRREAEVVSRLDHPGICGIFDAEIEGELAYIAMPFVEGCTLASAVAEARDDRAPEGVPFVLAPQSDAEMLPLLAFFEEAARALHSAHEAGIVHRDVKPGNLMVTPEGKPVWLDFGQARDSQSHLVELTLSGEIFGTPAYMSPEQVLGGSIDRRTDVWSLGVSLFEALTLRRPFEASTAQRLMLAIQIDEPRRAREFNAHIEGELAVVLATAMERDLTRRYKSALDLAEDLARLRRREPIAAQPASRTLRARRWVQRYPVLFALICVVSVSLVGVSWLLYEQVKLVDAKDAALFEKEQKLVAALGRHKAQRAEALLSEDPASALIVAIEAVELAPNALTREALFAALDECQQRAVYEAGDKKRFADLCLVPVREAVAAVRFDGTAMLFERETGRELATWDAHAPGEGNTPGGRVVASSRDGQLVATGGSDGRIVVRDLEAGTTTLEFEAEGGAVLELVFGGVGGELLVGSEEGVVMIRLDGSSIATSLGDGLPAGSRFRFDPELGSFVPRSAEGVAKARRALGPVRPTPPLDAAFSPDGSRFAAIDADGVLRQWNAVAGTLLSEGSGYLKPSELEWSADGEFVLTHQTLGPQARLWYGTERPDVYTLRAAREEVTNVGFSTDGEAAFVDSGLSRTYWRTPTGPGGGGESGRFLGRGRIFGGATTTDGSALDLAALGFAAEPPSTEVRGMDSNGEAPSVGSWRSIWPDPAGRIVLTVDELGGTLMAQPPGHAERLWSVDLADASSFRSASPGGTSSESAASVTDSDALVRDVAFDPTGRYAAIARADRRIDFVDLKDGSAWREPLAVFPPAGVDWSADGRRLLVWGRSGRGAFRVQDLDPKDGGNGAMRAEDFHADDLTAACFSVDGQLALTASRDGTILVRDVSGTVDPRSTRVVAHLRGHGSEVTCAVFSPGEGPVRVLAGFLDGTARVWPVDPLPPAIARRPRAELREWERAREERFADAVQLEYR